MSRQATFDLEVRGLDQPFFAEPGTLADGRLLADKVLAPRGAWQSKFPRQVMLRIRKQIQRVRQFVVFGILHADDPPHRLALGIAIGIFVTFTPTVGFQMVSAVFLAWLLRANKAVGIPIVWISNPATLVPIFYPCYVVGRWMLGLPPIEAAWWNALASPPAAWWPAVSFYWSRLLEIAAPLWLGCLVVATAAAVPTYYASYYLIRWYRLKRWGQLTPPTPLRHRSAVCISEEKKDDRVEGERMSGA